MACSKSLLQISPCIYWHVFIALVYLPAEYIHPKTFALKQLQSISVGHARILRYNRYNL